MSIRLPALVSAVAVLAVACAGSPTSSVDPSPSDGEPTEPALPTPKTVASPVPGGAGGDGPPFPDGTAPPRPLLEAVSADAASQVGVDPAAVTLVDARAVTWPDSSLGCPKPGMLYTQALVSGWQVVVRAADRDLDYRVRAADRFKLCERP